MYPFESQNCAISQKIELFITIIVRTADPALRYCFVEAIRVWNRSREEVNVPLVTCRSLQFWFHGSVHSLALSPERRRVASSRDD
jgi:hypothetical protein